MMRSATRPLPRNGGRSIFFPAGLCRLLAQQQDRPLTVLRCAAAGRVRIGRHGAPDRHKAAMIAGLSTMKEIIMTQIGTFTRNDDGSLNGSIVTLAVQAKNVRLIPSDPAATSEKAPDLRVFASGIEIGAAWSRTSKDDRAYHSVKLDDPSFTAPVYANLFEGEDGKYALIWSR
jgi:uncharacterized protein (DUF736 family)